MEIRQAVLSDAAVIAAYNVELARESEGLVLDPGIVRQGVEAVLGDASKGLYYVACVDGAVAGMVMLTYEWSDWRNGNFWWLQSVYVAPAHRSRGVFKSLYAHVGEQARRAGNVAGFRLYVDADNERAQQTYSRLGMACTNYKIFGQPAHD